MKNLFVYGSLMYPAVWRRLVRRRYPSHPARLRGYRRFRVKGETYPGLLRARGGVVSGVVYLGVRQRDLTRLDRFEGHCYRRVPVRVEVDGLGRQPAEVYLFRPGQRRRLSTSEWDEETFARKGLQRFLTAYSGF